jgi:hypothetical protein
MTIYPDVPRAPGVPALLRAPGQTALLTAVLLTSDSPSTLRRLQASMWGLFDQSGAPVVVTDSTLLVDYKHEYQLASYPMEKGAFQSYNKVQLPYDARLRVTIGGSQAARSSALAQAEAALASLDLYIVVTPDYTYPNASVVHIDYHREARRGISLLTIDLWMLEVRVTTSSQFTSTKSPTGSALSDNGTVQSSAPSTSTTQPASPPPAEKPS